MVRWADVEDMRAAKATMVPVVNFILIVWLFIVMLYLVGVLLDDVELVTGQSLKMKYYALYKKLVASTSRKKV